MQLAAGAAHEIPRMQIADEPRPVAMEKQPRVVAVRPQETRGDFDQSRGQPRRHVVALRQRIPEHLLRDDDALGRDRHHLRGHAAERMDEHQLLKQAPVVAEPRLGRECRLVAPAKLEHAADPLRFARQVEFVDGAVGPCERPRLHPAADAVQPGIRLLQRVFDPGRETEILQAAQRRRRAPAANRVAQRGPLGARAFEQAYFVFGEEDEIAVRICSETALGCRRAEASERRQSSLVIVLKSGSFDGTGEVTPAEPGGLAGEEVLHDGSVDMRATSRPSPAMAKRFYGQVVRKWPDGGQSVGDKDRVEKSCAGPTRVARRKRASARRPIDSTGGPADTLLRQFRGPIA